MKSINTVLFKVIKNLATRQTFYFRQFIADLYNDPNFTFLQMYPTNMFPDIWKHLSSQYFPRITTNASDMMFHFFTTPDKYDNFKQFSFISILCIYVYELSIIIGFGKYDRFILDPKYSPVIPGNELDELRNKIHLFQIYNTTKGCHGDVYGVTGKNLDELGIAKVNLKDINPNVINSNKLARDNLFINPNVSSSPYAVSSHNLGLVALGLSGSSGFPFNFLTRLESGRMLLLYLSYNDGNESGFRS